MEYMIKLDAFLKSETKKKKIIYPENQHLFEAFNQTPFGEVKAIILGQDPYHGENQAHGMSFSVNRETPIPPSLRNIFKELEDDLQVSPPSHGNLLTWAQQGVLLLNTVLTVEKSKAGSHRNRGWEIFTDQVIKILSKEREHLVFFLWGSPAHRKASLIDKQKHLILKAPHPSPLSAYRGFFGRAHFSSANKYLRKHGKLPINWSIPS